MASGNPALHHLAIDCRVDDQPVAALVAAARAFGAALPAQTAARLAIITEELVSNLIDHAALPADSLIELTLALHADRVRLTLRDAAAAFDPRCAAQTPVPARGGAAGLALVRAWAVIESYDRADDRNLLSLSLPIA